MRKDGAYIRQLDDLFREMDDRKELSERADVLRRYAELTGTPESVDTLRDDLIRFARTTKGYKTDAEAAVYADAILKRFVAQLEEHAAKKDLTSDDEQVP